MEASHDHEAVMAQGIYYEVDGRISGPVTFIQLQLLASSGMLQPQHRVRKEDSDHWVPARQVKGLFSPAEVAAAASVQAAPTPVPEEAEALAEQDTEFSFGSSSPTDEPGIISAFNFFKDSPAPAPPPAPAAPPLAPAAPPGPAPQPKKKQKHENRELAPPPPVVEDIPVAKAAEPKVAPRAQEPTFEPAPSTGPKTDVVGPVVTTVEVTGQAVELLPDDTARPIDGKAYFRLTRNWLLASIRFADGTTRTVYLRPQMIEAAILDQRPAAPRTKGGPFPVLAFRSGNVEVALA